MSVFDEAGWAWVFAITLTLLTLLSIAIATVRLRRTTAAFMTKSAVIPVTIVRPLCGLERFSEETLASTFRLEHPDYEVVFCVASSGDPIIPLAQRVMAANPQIPARLLIGDDRISDNPKLNNCVKGWEAATRDWVILADSNVLMPPDYVERMMSGWRTNTGLVCATPIGARPDGFWAEVECAFLNTLQARWQYTGEAVGLGFAQGKSMLWYKPFLDGRGGIRALAAEMAEDAAATKIVRKAGLSVHLVDRPFEQPLGERRAQDVWSRQLRWARLRFVTFPLFFVPEILSGPAIGVFAILLGAGLTLWSALAVIVMLGAWYAAEIAMAKRVGWYRSWRLPLAMLVRDLIIPVLWAATFATRNVVWRGNAMHITTKSSTEVPAGAS